MKTLALQIPGFANYIPGPTNFQFNSDNTTSLGYVGSKVLEVVFTVAVFLVFFWALMGIFQYILAGGDKEKLAKARSRITWAFFGFVILVIAFALSQYLEQIFPIQNVPPVNVVPPVDTQQQSQPAGGNQ